MIVIGRNWAKFRAVFRSWRTTLILTAAAILIAGNWFTYIYGVKNGLVVETSLGYFINPLVSVVLGVLIFGERLRRAQWTAVGLATIAVVVLTVDYGRLPYLALVLAFTFGQSSPGNTMLLISAGAATAGLWGRRPVPRPERPIPDEGLYAGANHAADRPADPPDALTSSGRIRRAAE